MATKTALDYARALAERVAPIYLADGPITVEIVEGGGTTLRRGDATVGWPEERAVPFGALRALMIWEPWLAKTARLGTLRWLLDHAHLAAGGTGLTASVQSQLTRAGLLQRSRMWGWETSAGELEIWIICELARRESRSTHTKKDCDDGNQQ